MLSAVLRFFLLGGAALLAACAQPDSLPLLALFLLAFYASSTALHSGVSASVSAHGSAAYPRYVTTGDIGSATGRPDGSRSTRSATPRSV